MQKSRKKKISVKHFTLDPHANESVSVPLTKEKES